MWTYRERLNYYEKLRRSLYEILRDTLEMRLMKISLIDSFYNFQKNGIEYNFLEKSELKPKSKKMEKESELYNTFIVIFCEGIINAELKNYLRFFPENKVIKKNVEYLAEFSLAKSYHTNLRYFDEPKFLDFVEDLLGVDYALLVQQDPTVKKRNRYSLTHFHVKIDWPIADAAELYSLGHTSQDSHEALNFGRAHLLEIGRHDPKIPAVLLELHVLLRWHLDLAQTFGLEGALHSLYGFLNRD